jgi:hypothetical protein
MIRLSVVSLLLLLASLLPVATHGSEVASDGESSMTYCACQYNVPFEEEADCRSYGQLGDQNLIPWYRANQTCLDEYQIKISALDEETLWAMCPYENSTNVSIQLLMNEIRYNPSPATRAIQAAYPDFWFESNVTAGTYELVDVVHDSRNNPNCVESATLCWSAIREYFTIHIDEVGVICKELHARNRFDRDLEQSTVRIRLCQEVDLSANESSSVCERLLGQVGEVKSMNPSTACSAFGLGPGTQQLPTNCSAAVDSQETSSSRRTLNSYGGMLSCLVLTWTVTLAFLLLCL